MKPLLILVRPLDLATNLRVDVRVASVPSPYFAGLGGFTWEGAVSRRPRIMLDLMSPKLDGKVQTGRGDFMLNLNEVRVVAEPWKLHWSGAPVTIYDATAGDYATMPIEFTGIVSNDQLDVWTKQVILNLEVEKNKLERPLLTLEFDGSGGAGGDADRRGTLKPAGFGYVENVEPVWFDENNNVGMLDGYANLTTVHGLFEGGDDRGASFGNYATYAALVAAAIPPGRWATCLAEGLVRLGAPPAMRISCDCTFRTIAGNGANRPGALLQRILTTHAGLAAGELDAASFAALDVAVPRNVHYWTKDQREILDLVEAISASCNATTLILLNGLVAVTRAFGGANIGTVNRTGTSNPPVSDWEIAGAEEPLWRMRARSVRPGAVFTFDEILYEDDLIDMGAFNIATVYRQGNLVWGADGAQFLYINATPAAGHALPVLPATADAWWQRTKPPATAADLVYADGTPIENLKPAQPGADVTGSNTAAAVTGQGPWATFGDDIKTVKTPNPNLLKNGSLRLAGFLWTLSSPAPTLTTSVDGNYWSIVAGRWARSPRFAAAAGDWTASFETNPTATNNAYFLFRWYDASDVEIGTSANINIDVNGWLRKDGTATAPAGTAWGRVEFQPNATTLRVRKIKAEKGNVATVFSDEATDGALYQSGATVDSLQPAEVGSNVTETRTAAAIQGQGQWATYSTLTPTTIANRTQNLTTGGQMDFQVGILTATRRINYTMRADGVTGVGEVDVITPLGTAAAIAGQGALATLSEVGPATMRLWSTANLLLDPTLSDTTYWNVNDNWTLIDSATGGAFGNSVRFYLQSQAGNGTTVQAAAVYRHTQRLISVEPDRPYRASARTHVQTGFTGILYISILWFKADGVTASANPGTNLLGTDYRVVACTATTTSAIDTLVTVPSDAAWAMYRLTLTWSTTLNNAQQGFMTAPKFQRAVDGDGAIPLAFRLNRHIAREDGTTYLTDALAVTSLGTSAAISGQGALATLSQVNLGVAGRVYRDDGSTRLTDALAVTSLGTAAAISGQGALATLSQVNLGTSGRVYRDDGSTRLTDALAVTSLGTAAAISGQGALATLGQVNLGASGRVYRDDGTTRLTDALAVTSLGTAAAISGQGALATLGQVNFGVAGRVYRDDGTTRVTDSLAITGLGTAAAIASQGAFATLNTAPASLLDLGDASNLVLDSSIEDPNYWLVPVSWTINTTDGDVTGTTAADLNAPAAFKIVATGANPQALSQVQSVFMPVEPGKQYRQGAKLKMKAGFNGLVTLYTYWYLRTGTGASTVATTVVSGTDYRAAPLGADTVVLLDALGGVAAPADAFQARWTVRVTWPGAAASAGTLYVAYPRLHRAVDANMAINNAFRLNRHLAREDGTTSVTDALAITSLGTSAAISGQGALATLSQVNLGASGRVYRDDGTTRLTDALAVTSLGTAAAISGQGALATLSQVNLGSSGRVYRDDGTTRLTDALAVTSLGTSAAISGQGWFATASSVSLEDNTRVTNKTRISLLDPATGVGVDSRIVPANVNLGMIPTLKDAVTLSDTANGATVTINVGNAVYYPDVGGTITFPSGTVAGLAYATKYYIKRVGVDRINDADGTGWNAATSLTIGVGDVYIGTYTTRATSGTPSPPPPPPPGGGQDCVAVGSWLPEVGTADKVVAGDEIRALDYATMQGDTVAVVTGVGFSYESCVEIETASGAQLVLSTSAPVTLKGGQIINVLDVMGKELPVGDDHGFTGWERVMAVRDVGRQLVARIHAGGATYAAGKTKGSYIYTHNPSKP